MPAPRPRPPVVLLLVLFALACALGPLVAATDATTPAPEDYVALGDSYSSGLGAGGDDDGCRRSPVAFPAIVAAARPGTALRAVACAGARIQDVRATQLAALRPGTRIVTLTVGGNDAGFAAVLARCALPGWVARCAPVVRRARTFIARTLPARFTRLLGEIRARAPSATVVVAGYPRLLGSVDCGAFTFFSAGDRRLLNGTAERLRDVLRASARKGGASFADVTGVFRGHAVCDEPEWLNGLSTPLRESFHPNATGHALGYAPAVLRALAGRP